VGGDMIPKTSMVSSSYRSVASHLIRRFVNA
jgi:hypothetical protein